MQELFARGGPLMWPLLFCSVLSATVTIERLLFWLRMRLGREPDVVEDMFELTEQGRFEAAIERGYEVDDFVARVLTAGLTYRDHGLSEELEAAATEETIRMRRGLGVLETIVGLAPLLGILGTVLGIIESFDVLSTGLQQAPTAVTGGIAKALVTTAAGLSVAIATLIPHNFLVSLVQRGTDRLQSAVTRFEVAYRQGREESDGA